MNKLLKYTFFSLAFVSGLCLEQIVKACGGGEDPYDYYLSFFHNNTGGSPAYLPFYFVTGYQYYEEWNGGIRNNEEDLNLKEWMAFAPKQFGLKDASDFIYGYKYDQLSNLYYHIEQGKPLQLPDSVQRNGMTQWFLKDKDLEALGYLMYAKKCERYTVQASEWDAPAKDTKGMGSQIKSGKQLWKAAKKDFFQWRYAYQVLRLSFYSEDYAGMLTLWKELIGDKTADNIMYYRCLSLKAGTYYKAGDYNTAAYLYAMIFDATDDNKASNYVSYDWCFRPHGNTENGPRADRAAVLKLTKSNREKAVIAVMDGLHEYDEALPLMKEAYGLDPAVKGLDVVMTREVNKMEMNLLDPRLRSKSGFDNSVYAYTGNYYYSRGEDAESRKEREKQQRNLQELIAFGARLSAENKAANPAFWPLSVAYLYFIQEDWKNCGDWLGKAAAQKPEGRLQHMLQIEQLLYTIGRSKKLDAATEAAILPALQWLEQQATKDNRFALTYRNLMTSVLPNAYTQQGDTMKALLCIAKGTTGPEGKGIYSYWYGEQGQNKVYVDPGFSAELEQTATPKIIALKTWIKEAKKTPYEAFLVKYPPYEQGALDLYIGTRYLRQMDFAKAADMFKNVPREVLKRYAFQDPFAERWTDTQEPRDTSLVSDKYRFAKDMQQLEAGIDKADANEVYKYANGLYSMTYYGLSWKAAAYYRSGVDGMAYYADTQRNKLLPEYRYYYTAELAAKYYQLAFDRSGDKELKAKCLFMLSKCWQKNATIPHRYFYSAEDNNEYYQYAAQSPYFKQLSENYSQTNAFKFLHEDCSYLRYYVRKANKK